MVLRRILPVLCLVLFITACTRSNGSDIERNPEGGLDATVTITESDMNSDIAAILADQPNPLLRNPQVDLQPGKIIINGEHDQRDGGGTVNGSLTVEVNVVDGKLQASVTAASIEGLDLSDARVTMLNEQLAGIFARRAERDRGAFTVKSAAITDNELTLVVNLQRQ
jgi:hypothetical protein